MPSIGKLSIALTGEQAEAIRAVVDAGEYATTSEVIREAIRDWQMKRELRQGDMARLRQAWDKGVASGSAGKVNMAALRKEARARLEAARKSDARAG